MRRISALALSFVLVFAVAGCTANKIAVVNPARLFQESDSGKAGFEHLKQLEASMQAQVQVAQSMLEKSPNDEALRTRFQKTFSGYQQLVNGEQQKVVTKINDLMQKSLDTYRTQKGYTVIVNSDGLLSYDPKADVTSEVIAEMNRTPVTFEPVKVEEIAPAKADSKDAPKAEAPGTDAKK